MKTKIVKILIFFTQNENVKNKYKFYKIVRNDETIQCFLLK